MQKGEHGLAPLEVFYPFSFWHHTLSSFFFVDLAVELASNWHGFEAIRNLIPAEDLIGVTARQDLTATHPIAQQDHSALSDAAPWWLHA